MDLQAEELQFLTISDILRESISIPKQSPRTFYLITLSLVFPLSFAILAHSLFTHPILTHLQSSSSNAADWLNLLAVQFAYLTFLFAFSLLSTAAVVFTVASLYAGKPVSFSSTFAAVPKVLKRLFVTFVWVSILMIAYYAVFFGSVVLLVVAMDTHNVGLFVFSLLAVFALFLVVHVYMSALWHLASVISVLEPVYGSAAIRKSYELLKGKTRVGFGLVFAYLSVCGMINGFFGAIVVRGGDDYGVLARVLAGGFLVGVLVVVNLIGLLAQSVFYYVCKSYHHQGIDKAALYDHLGGYLGEYVPLKSSIQMEDMDA